MFELAAYAVKGEQRETMVRVIRLLAQNGTLWLENIFGESKQVMGQLGELDIAA